MILSNLEMQALPITQLGMVSDLKFYTYGISRQRDYI
jgi:hypothetical protein